jgi:Bacterial protein of unknown function (DUF937)
VPTNLISLVTQFLTPDMIGRIAAALGLDRGSIQTAISAAVPALLAGFTGAASKPGGAQNLVDAVKQQSGMLDGFAKKVGSGGQSSLIDQGSRSLTSLLGGQDQSALAGAVAKFSGLSPGASGSLLGMLAPIVMGIIGKQIGTRGLDVNSLTGLLSEQKDQIVKALPPGFSNLLGGSGLLDSLGGVTGTAAAAAGQVTEAATAATDRAAQFTTSATRAVGNTSQRAASATTSAMPGWLYWLIPLIIVAGALWYLLSDRAEQTTQQVPAIAQSVMVGGVDIGKQLSDSLGMLQTSLQGITDEASATAALPKLQGVKTQVDKIASVAGQLSPEQRKVIVGLVGPAMATLNQLFDKVLAIPGVGEILKPTLDAVKTNLAVLAA